MRDLTLSEIERLRSAAAESDAVFEMDEETFRAFYDRTARPLWVYLSRMSGSNDTADDLLQETYYRFLRARRQAPGRSPSSEFAVPHRHQPGARSPAEWTDGRSWSPCPKGRTAVRNLAAPTDVAGDAERRTDLQRALARLKPREREMLWLAYAQGLTHLDIAGALGVKAASVRLLFFRARQKLARLLAAPPGRGRRQGE